MALPIMLTKDASVNQMQTLWSSQLNPVLNTPIINGLLLTGISLATGSNIINHTLGKKLQGWIVVRMKDSYLQIYDQQNSNRTPELTLMLHSNASGTVDLWVF